MMDTHTTCVMCGGSGRVNGVECLNCNGTGTLSLSRDEMIISLLNDLEREVPQNLEEAEEFTTSNNDIVDTILTILK